MAWPEWLQWYKKPSYRDIKEYSTAISSGKRSLSPGGDRVVPGKLKLQKVLDNKTCSPMSLFDFYMYLKHIEFSEENLEFYLWYKNYEKAADHSSLQKDSHSYHSFDSDGPANSTEERLSEKGIITDVEHDGSNDSQDAMERIQAEISQFISSGTTCTQGSKCTLNCTTKTFVGLSRKKDAAPTTSMPSVTKYENELYAIVHTYLVPGAPKELNIPPAMRSEALANISHLPDPSHLEPIADHVYQLLRNCSHRNFVRLGVANGTFETVCCATGLGIILNCAGFLMALLLAFTPHRGYHSCWTLFGAWPLWWIGMTFIMTGLRGSCFLLLLFSRRQPLPWEAFADAERNAAHKSAPILRAVRRLMIFDRKLRVKDVHLRQLQHLIILQGLFYAAIYASIAVLVFIFLPVWSTSV